MFDKEVARTVVGIIGNGISLVLFLSPSPTFCRIWKNKSVEQFSPFPYLATYANCVLWVLYGLPIVTPNSTLVMTINGTGFAIEVVFLSLFLTFCRSKKKRLWVIGILVAECIFLAALAVIVLTVVHKVSVRSTIVGSVGIAGNIMMYSAPLSVMKMVITTKSVEYMPFFLSLFSFLNGVCWTTYALLKFDPFILTPNAMGTLLGMAQLILYATYYKSTQRIMAQRKANGEVGLTQTPAAGNNRNGQASKFNEV